MNLRWTSKCHGKSTRGACCEGQSEREIQGHLLASTASYSTPTSSPILLGSPFKQEAGAGTNPGTRVDTWAWQELAGIGPTAWGKCVTTLDLPSFEEVGPNKLASSTPSSFNPHWELITPRHTSAMDTQRAGFKHRAMVTSTVLDSGQSTCRPKFPYVPCRWHCHWKLIPERSSAISSSENGETTTTTLVMKCGHRNSSVTVSPSVLFWEPHSLERILILENP